MLGWPGFCHKLRSSSGLASKEPDAPSLTFLVDENERGKGGTTGVSEGY
jgi:hypothetical protein